MQEVPIQWIALIVAVVVKQALGAFWFFAFGRSWSALTGLSDADMRSRLPRILPIEIVAALVMAFVLGRAVRYADAYGVLSGAKVGFMCWLGFVAVAGLNTVLYGRRSTTLYFIEMGYWLVSLVVMGAILGAWW